MKGEELIQTPGKYLFLELMWIGDFNPKMVAIAEELETKKVKR